MALFTFGEGYHNYHHAFQHDYRNGVKAWQFDPTKWLIWTLSRLGLVSNLRCVPETKILLAEAREAQRLLSAHLETPAAPMAEKTRQLLLSSQEKLTRLMQDLSGRKEQYVRATGMRIEHSRKSLGELRREIRLAIGRLERVGKLAPARCASRPEPFGQGGLSGF